MFQRALVIQQLARIEQPLLLDRDAKLAFEFLLELDDAAVDGNNHGYGLFVHGSDEDLDLTGMDQVEELPSILLLNLNTVTGPSEGWQRAPLCHDATC